MFCCELTRGSRQRGRPGLRSQLHAAEDAVSVVRAGVGAPRLSLAALPVSFPWRSTFCIERVTFGF